MHTKSSYSGASASSAPASTKTIPLKPPGGGSKTALELALVPPASPSGGAGSSRSLGGSAKRVFQFALDHSFHFQAVRVKLF